MEKCRFTAFSTTGSSSCSNSRSVHSRGMATPEYLCPLVAGNISVYVGSSKFFAVWRGDLLRAGRRVAVRDRGLGPDNKTAGPAAVPLTTRTVLRNGVLRIEDCHMLSGQFRVSGLQAFPRGSARLL